MVTLKEIEREKYQMVTWKEVQDAVRRVRRHSRALLLLDGVAAAGGVGLAAWLGTGPVHPAQVVAAGVLALLALLAAVDAAEISFGRL